jgi:hypothetical protein
MRVCGLCLIFCAAAFGAPQAATVSTPKQELPQNGLKGQRDSAESVKTEIERLKGQISALQKDVTLKAAGSQPAPPNWTQVWGLVLAAGALVANGFIALFVFRLNRQQAKFSGQSQTYLKILERMESCGDDRATLRRFIRERCKGTGTAKKVEDTVEGWTKLFEADFPEVELPPGRRTQAGTSKESLKEVLNRLTREFDILGFMDREGLVAERLVDGFYVAPLAEFVPIFTAYISTLRSRRRIIQTTVTRPTYGSWKSSSNAQSVGGIQAVIRQCQTNG